jgi:hypothetical protein
MNQDPAEVVREAIKSWFEEVDAEHCVGHSWEKRRADECTVYSEAEVAMSALDSLLDRLAKAEQALREIDEAVGRGFADIVVANTVLGRIQTIARTFLNQETKR